MNLAKMSDGDLERMFRSCVNAITQAKPNAGEAEKRLGEINAIWRTRLSAALEGRYKAESPEVGVLKTLGYQVGKEGLPERARRALLDYAMSGNLPFVGSPAHMMEWGDPCTSTRYRKLHRVLAGFATSARTQGEHMSVAGANWEADLAYVEDVWKPKAK